MVHCWQLSEVFVKNLRGDINEQQDATEFYMKYSFDAFLHESSLSTAFTVKVSGKCRECSKVVTSESSIRTVLTIPICYDVSGENLSSHFLHEVKQISKLKKCRCSCTDFFQGKSVFDATPEVLCLILWRTAGGIQKNDKRVVPYSCLFLPTSEGHSTYILETRVAHLGSTILIGHCVCYPFNKAVVTELNDNKRQQVLSQTVIEKIASGGCLFFCRKNAQHGKSLADNISEMKKEVQKNQVYNEEIAVKTIMRKRRKPCAPMQSYECVTFEDFPLRFYDDEQPPKIITTVDHNRCLERFEKVCNKVLECLNIDLSQGKCVFACVSPLSFLCGEKNKLFQYNASFDVLKELSECECKNLWCFVRHAMPEVKVIKEVLADGEVRRELKSGIFFNSSIIQPSSHKFLDNIAVMDYIKEVGDFESVLFYIMERDKITYCDAAGRLGCDSKLYESGSQRLQT